MSLENITGAAEISAIEFNPSPEIQFWDDIRPKSNICSNTLFLPLHPNCDDLPYDTFKTLLEDDIFNSPTLGLHKLPISYNTLLLLLFNFMIKIHVSNVLNSLLVALTLQRNKGYIHNDLIMNVFHILQITNITIPKSPTLLYKI